MRLLSDMERSRVDQVGGHAPKFSAQAVYLTLLGCKNIICIDGKYY